MEHFDFAIIGGGLCGLHTASMLTARGASCVVIEARDRFGGRVLSASSGSDSKSRLDMGPSWFWPDTQPRMRELIGSLGLETFPQTVDGAVLVERFRHEPARRYTDSGVATSRSMRVTGGMASLTEAIAATLPVGSLRLGSRASKIAFAQHAGVRIDLTGRRGPQVLTASRVVLAVPPRLVVRDIKFSPALPPELLAALSEIPTWMAGQAKTAIVYQDCFWAEQELSGTASSFVGPLGEVHDSTPLTGRPALFGFVALPAKTRAAIGVKRLHELTIAQLVRLFGSRAAAPVTITTTDWALERLTCTAADLQPDCGLASRSPQGLATLWDRQLVIAGSELAPDYAGYLEGALSAAVNAVMILSLQ